MEKIDIKLNQDCVIHLPIEKIKELVSYLETIEIIEILSGKNEIDKLIEYLIVTSEEKVTEKLKIYQERIL